LANFGKKPKSRFWLFLTKPCKQNPKSNFWYQTQKVENPKAKSKTQNVGFVWTPYLICYGTNTRSVRDLNARLLGRLFGRILPSRHNKDAFLAQSDRGDLEVAVFLLRLSLQENREKQLTKII
jgi:hypothetical protein